MKIKNKKCEVVMLPTKNKSNIWLRNNILEYNSSTSNKINPQHLYILSDDEIKEGDYYFSNLGKDVGQPIRKSLFDRTGSTKKVIATTDKSLKRVIEGFKGEVVEEYLPQPSKAFVQKYCKLGGINEVMVEYMYDVKKHKKHWIWQ